jgi:hypothetical protein
MKVHHSIIGMLLVLHATACRHQKSPPDGGSAGDSSAVRISVDDRTGTPCTKQADCEPGLVCSYMEPGCDHPARACEPSGSCTVAVRACSCDGRDIDICPSTRTPYVALGRCNGEDKPCSNDGECNPGLRCGREPGCDNARGRCQSPSHRSCTKGLKVTACGCDGKEFDLCQDPFRPHKNVGLCERARIGDPCSTDADCHVGDCAYVEAGCDRSARRCQLVGKGCPRSLTLCGCDGKDIDMCLSAADGPSPPFLRSGTAKPFRHVGSCSEH